MAKLAPSRVLLPGDFKEISFANTRWSINLPEPGDDVKLDDRLADLENHEFWKHVVKKMKPGDVVEVRTVDHEVFAEVYIRATDPFAVVQVMRAHKLGNETKVEGNFTIKWVIAKKSHVVFLNGQELRTGFQTKEAAAAWIDEHKKQVTAKAA
jgi:hypothetical protein